MIMHLAFGLCLILNVHYGGSNSGVARFKMSHLNVWKGTI